jgi:hypothetical protein
MNTHHLGLLALVLVAALPAAAETRIDPQALTRCRSIAADVERLHCYDQIADAAPAAPALPPAPPAVNAATADVAPTADATVPAPDEPKAPVAAADEFGAETLPQAAAAKAEQAPDEIRSRIPGEFRGWDAKTRFELENGQVWECVNCRSVYLLKQNPEVTIKRSFIGGYWLRVDGLNTQARVRRIK